MLHKILVIDDAASVHGLIRARLAEEPPDPAGDGSENAPSFPVTVTRTGAVLGTLAYMSPEQFRGEPLDARTHVRAHVLTLVEAPLLVSRHAASSRPNSAGSTLWAASSRRKRTLSSRSRSGPVRGLPVGPTESAYRRRRR